MIARTIVFLALTLLPAVARLGETEAQCVARYGPVVKSDTSSAPLSLPMLVFIKNGYVLAAVMLDGKVGMEMIKKVDDTEDFSDNEVDALLQADSGGQAWTKADVISTSAVWNRGDGAQAQHDPLDHSLVILSKEYIAASDAAKKKDEDQKLNGF